MRFEPRYAAINHDAKNKIRLFIIMRWITIGFGKILTGLNTLDSTKIYCYTYCMCSAQFEKIVLFYRAKKSDFLSSMTCENADTIGSDDTSTFLLS